ncbi:MAG: SUMF1/EgtB/PvdO family nonheme iron enzyme [Bacteroidota bacterium]
MKGIIGAGLFFLIIIISVHWTDLKWAIFPDFHQDKLTTLFPDSLMVKVVGGPFTLGPIPDQEGDYTSNKVNISDFYISKYEISQEQYNFVLNNTLEDEDDYHHISHHRRCPKCPVENVSEKGIDLFLQGLYELTGKKYRLPTEAEWEYAARGGQKKSNNFSFSGSKSLDEVAWNQRNANNETHPVGQKQPNELGLFDMTGNVNEWVLDTWHDTYEGAPTNGSEWVGTSGRVIRGGGYKNAGETCLTTYRYEGDPTRTSEDVGFRIVLAIAKESSQSGSTSYNRPDNQKKKKYTVKNGTSLILVKGNEQYLSNVNRQDQSLIADFYLSESEVTNSQFANFLNATGSNKNDEWYESTGVGDNNYGKALIKFNKLSNQWEVITGGEELPVNYVNLEGARAYCKWLGKKYRLPTKIEWQYAAAGGKECYETYEKTNAQGTSANCENKLTGNLKGTDVYYGRSPIKAFPANTLGLYDLIGNVWEWTSTPVSNQEYVVLGGSYGEPEWDYTVPGKWPQNHQTFGLGFRVAKTP